MINRDTLHNQARQWSAQLGDLAASTSVASTPTPATVPQRLQELLAHLRNRSQAREHARERMRATEFVMDA